MKIDVAKNKFIEITIKNGRDLTLLHNIDSIKITTEKKDITKLDFYEHSVEVGNTIGVTINRVKHNYFINYIIQTSDYGFELSCEKLTKSSVFLMPLIAEKEHNLKAYFYNTYFYNCYYKYKGEDLYNDSNHLFLVYRFFDSDYYKELEEYIRSNSNFVKTIEPNKELTVYVMSIPQKFQQDVKRLIKGNYSKISTTAKSKIITFHQAHIESELAHILYKKPQLKKQIEEYLDCTIPEDVELCSKPELHREEFSYGI